MPKREPVLKYKAPPSGVVGTQATVLSAVADHGSLLGLGDDDHGAYGALTQDETVSGHWTLLNATISGEITGLALSKELYQVQGGTVVVADSAGVLATSMFVPHARFAPLTSSTPSLTLVARSAT